MLVGFDSNSRFGSYITAAGDVDRDGFNDFVVGKLHCYNLLKRFVIISCLLQGLPCTTKSKARWFYITEMQTARRDIR